MYGRRPHASAANAIALPTGFAGGPNTLSILKLLNSFDKPPVLVALRKTISGIGLQEAKMPFYVVRDQGTGRFLSLLEDRWAEDLREAAVFSERRTATRSIRVAWQGRCVVERIERLPDRIGLPRRPRRHSTLPRPVLDQIW